MRNSRLFKEQSYASRSSGFSLLEVLVSIVVVTMGLLGLAGMSMRSLAANDSSGHRAAAAMNAAYMADLMRANRQAIVENQYVVALGAAGSGTGRPKADIDSWKALLAQLPSGDGSIAWDAGNRAARVVVRWNDARGNQSNTETATYQTYEYSFNP